MSANSPPRVIPGSFVRVPHCVRLLRGNRVWVLDEHNESAWRDLDGRYIFDRPEDAIMTLRDAGYDVVNDEGDIQPLHPLDTLDGETPDNA